MVQIRLAESNIERAISKIRHFQKKIKIKLIADTIVISENIRNFWGEKVVAREKIERRSLCGRLVWL